MLYGKVRVKAYDWVGAKTFLQPGEVQPARLAVERHVRGGEPPVVLHARRGGNIHSFKAESACAVMDLIAPPYDMDVPGTASGGAQNTPRLYPDMETHSFGKSRFCLP